MFVAIGIIVLLVMVFGGFILAGGAIGPVLAALPLEFMIIGGAAIGAVLIGNSTHEIKLLASGLKKVFVGPKYNDQDHIDAIALTSKLMKLLRTEGAVALESHVTEPANSAIFSEYPRIQNDRVLTTMICDPLTLLVVSSGTLDTHAVEEVIDSAIKTELHEMAEPEHTIQSLADAFPALGIVAAVLGVIKTMGSINEPPEVLGKMIGAALVGTFLGVLLAYGFVGPMASRLKQINTRDQQVFHSIKQVIIASLHGYPQPLVLEAARSGLAPSHRPKLTELLDMMRSN
ncbi:chemotaxis protein MotA [Erythrobacter litoralis]|uniref:Flagellar motor protein MotA n=1 Tax=Erythrobacter litoralis TaxID=39960 RepID=A0A074MGK8_9SPHN|nr:flagellar motor stator protein MotA [Erythrobacter litoralis]AOL22267.1 chemotaxis protein MotA [Erythrobacter litoralis]KEO90983.1 flagellar motor protein MotA [Erythrobacter litoralis]MEE4337407.1 flagellar motor stator protein MotA [Erythrobacter sp.]